MSGKRIPERTLPSASTAGTLTTNGLPTSGGSTLTIPFGQSANWTPEAGEIAAKVYGTVYAQAVDTRPENTVPRTFITQIDRPVIFRAALNGAFDGWEEWFLGPR